MSDKRLLSAEEITALKIMAWQEFTMRDQNELWGHVAALQARLDAAKIALDYALTVLDDDGYVKDAWHVRGMREAAS